jgi:two-component system OmpR family response regulator
MNMMSALFPDAVTVDRDAPSILIVDDSRTNLQVMGRRLTRMGYCVSLCESGIEALDLLQARRFDLVVLDLVMPGLSGIATLREIRSSGATATLPVLMITGRSDDAAAIEALNAGADDHVAKPFAFDVFGARIDRLLARARAFDALQRSNRQLDARIAHRAMELGQLRSELTSARADRLRLVQSVEMLEEKLQRLNAGTSVPG